MISRTIQQAFSRPYLLLVLICLFSSSAYSATEKEITDKQITVAMRMIGHEVLNCIGDPKSRVMPVEKSGEQYKISFDLEFGFDPEDMVDIIEDIMAETGTGSNYLVEVEQCDTKEIVHSFMILNSAHSSLIPCEGRILPKACHNFLITIWTDTQFATGSALSAAEPEATDPFRSVFTVVPLLLLIGFIGYFIRKRQAADQDPHQIRIGDSRFDRKNGTLSFEHQSIELSNKEAELLSLLYTHANATVEREVLLRKVWEDEGDYVGRTLDVFISKLRKKLEADASVKIVNIRGVGYKLVV